MKKLLLLFLLLVYIPSKSQEKSIIQILPESHLSIKGSSNVNTFDCLFSSQKLKQKLIVNYTFNGDRVDFDDLDLLLDNVGFDCGHRGINKDFHKLLNTEIYPQIEFKIHSYNNKEQTAVISITIANVTKTYTLPIHLVAPHRIEGELLLNIKDYRLTPPKKMLGMIVVHENIEIIFSLVFKKLN